MQLLTALHSRHGHVRNIAFATVAMLAAILIASTSLLPTSVAMASTFGHAESQRSVDKYDELLDKALAALASGDAVEAEKVSFALTMLDDARCEGHAVLGAALARRWRGAGSPLSRRLLSMRRSRRRMERRCAWSS